MIRETRGIAGCDALRSATARRDPDMTRDEQERTLATSGIDLTAARLDRGDLYADSAKAPAALAPHQGDTV